jgi:chromosome segregation ATPase
VWLATLREEIHQDCHDKQVRRITEKYTQKLEDLQAWGRSQKMNIQELQDQNGTQEAIIKELWEQLEKTSQEVPKQEPMMKAEENPQELPQAAPAPPIFPQPNLYEQLMQDIPRIPRWGLSIRNLHCLPKSNHFKDMSCL